MIKYRQHIIILSLFIGFFNPVQASNLDIEFIINKVISNNSLNKTKNLANLVSISEINNLKNWIEFKKFSNQIFSEIASIN